MIQVSVGLCVKNCEKIVKGTIDSILDQDFSHELMEMIVVDDGSEDRTLSVILDSVSSVDMHVKVFHHEWRGLGPTRNVVVDNAFGEYIVWVDCGMILPSDYVRKQVEFMEENPRVGAAQGALAYERGRFPATLHDMSVAVHLLDKKSNGALKFVSTGGSIFRIKALRQVGGFDYNIKGAAEDCDIGARIKATGWLLSQTAAHTAARPPQLYRKTEGGVKELIVKYFGYGYGAHYVGHKNKGLFAPPWSALPPAAFWLGFKCFLKAYKITRQKISVFLPFQNTLKNAIWWFGFAKSHLDGYGHKKRLESTGLC